MTKAHTQERLTGTISIAESRPIIDAMEAAFRTDRARLLAVLAAAGVDLNEHDQAVVDAIARYEPGLVQAVAAWIERANPPAVRRTQEREALARIIARIETADAELGKPRHDLALGIILGLAKGALR